MIIEALVHYAECDFCGHRFYLTPYLLPFYEKKEVLLRDLESNGWQVDQLGEIRCDRCLGKKKARAVK